MIPHKKNSMKNQAKPFLISNQITWWPFNYLAWDYPGIDYVDEKISKEFFFFLPQIWAALHTLVDTNFNRQIFNPGLTILSLVRNNSYSLTQSLQPHTPHASFWIPPHSPKILPHSIDHRCFPNMQASFTPPCTALHVRKALFPLLSVVQA